MQEQSYAMFTSVTWFVREFCRQMSQWGQTNSAKKWLSDKIETISFAFLEGGGELGVEVLGHVIGFYPVLI